MPSFEGGGSPRISIGGGNGGGGNGSWWSSGGSGGVGSLTIGPAKNNGPAPTANVKQADMNGFNNAVSQRQTNAANKINEVYDKQINAAKEELKAAYDKNISDQEYARGQIGNTYRKKSNDAAIQYERNKRNLNAQAMANGLTTGSGTQQQLALNQLWNTEYGNLKASEAKEYADIEHQIANIKMQYNNDIQKAIAENDYKRAAALMDDYNNQQTWLAQQAQTMAGFGNFAGYSNMFGKDVANSMANIWARQNPAAAWAAGMIDDKTYRKASGQDQGNSGIMSIVGLG